MSYNEPYRNERNHMKESAYYNHHRELDIVSKHNSSPRNGKLYPGYNPYGYGFENEKYSKIIPDSVKSRQEKEPKEVIDVVNRFADYTSLQGIAYIKRATRWYAKGLWVFVFFIATVAWILHSTYLINLFIKYETTSSVSVVYERASFPTVTFCNMNPVRTNRIGTYGSRELINFLQSLTPKTKYRDDNQTTGSTQPQTGRRKLLSTYHYTYADYVDQEDLSIQQNTVNFSQYAGNQYSDYAYIINDASQSSDDRSDAALKEILSELPDSNRSRLGHVLSNMMLSCTFNGQPCSAQNFTRYLDINYGNCWSFNNEFLHEAPLISVRSGTKYGLDMILNIEAEDYIKGLNIGRGIRLHLHPFKTMPFVADSGISVSPGRQTYLGVRVTNQTRIGGIYGACNDDNGSFVGFYNNAYTYTLEGCINTCLDRTVLHKCGCYRLTQKQYYTSKTVKRGNYCKTAQEYACVSSLTGQFKSGTLNCGCNQACKTADYETLMSTDVWPDESLWFSLVDAVCVRSKHDCNYFKSVGTESTAKLASLRENFIHLQVFYRDLNVQKITESAQYDLFQFLSDLGGAMGLWVGASLLTLAELMDLSCQCCTFCRRRRKYKERKRQKEASVNADQAYSIHSDQSRRQKLPRTHYRGDRDQYYDYHNAV